MDEVFDSVAWQEMENTEGKIRSDVDALFKA
jgi:hypothetical protein